MPLEKLLAERSASQRHSWRAEVFLGRLLASTALALTLATRVNAQDQNQAGNPSDAPLCESPNLAPDCSILDDRETDLSPDKDINYASSAIIAQDGGSEINPPVAAITVINPTPTSTPVVILTPSPAPTPNPVPNSNNNSTISVNFDHVSSLSTTEKQNIQKQSSDIVTFFQTKVGQTAEGTVSFNFYDGTSPNGAPAEGVGIYKTSFWVGSNAWQRPEVYGQKDVEINRLQLMAHEYTLQVETTPYIHSVAINGFPRGILPFSWFSEAVAEEYGWRIVDFYNPNQGLFDKNLRSAKGRVQQNKSLDLSKLLLPSDFAGKPSPYDWSLLAYDFLITKEVPKSTYQLEAAAWNIYYTQAPIDGADVAFGKAYLDLSTFYRDFNQYVKTLPSS